MVKFLDFRLKSPSISETVRDRPMIDMEHYMESCALSNSDIFE